MHTGGIASKHRVTGPGINGKGQANSDSRRDGTTFLPAVHPHGPRGPAISQTPVRDGQGKSRRESFSANHHEVNTRAAGAITGTPQRTGRAREVTPIRRVGIEFQLTNPMPILPENKHRYPKDWKLRSRFVRFYRAKNRCEWCGCTNYQPHPVTGSKVVLTVAHVFDDRPEASGLLNLAALCQRCHNRHDAKDRKRRRRERIYAASGQMNLNFS